MASYREAGHAHEAHRTLSDFVRLELQNALTERKSVRKSKQ